MNINFLPSPAILGAILASLSLPILLIILSHGVWKVRALGKRFIVACWLIIGLWLVSLGFEIANSQESLALLLSNFFCGSVNINDGYSL
ncbi:hypothetical protein [Crocosphaera watsonii]|uniref:Uncharacterized protein n=1 Tax=Crocosphaera watsonii WH 8502 TaxID=423474 RepID=T2IB22_CROWT|nr:hypothetical protein [Crocosphaera watsonii]CCQ50017.1 hypothetical protein CWATWH8502_1805 [Crocosphaera watsonii WH 8502]